MIRKAVTSHHSTAQPCYEGSCATLINCNLKQDASQGPQYTFLHVETVILQCMQCRQTHDLCGQVSAKHFHCAAASRHSTRLFPKSFTGVGFDSSRSSTMATGYHCFVQENEPNSSAGSGTKLPSALQKFVCKGMYWCSQRILSSTTTASGHQKKPVRFHLDQPVRSPGQALLELWLNSLGTAGMLYANARLGEPGKPATSTEVPGCTSSVTNVITHLLTDRTTRRRHKLTRALRLLIRRLGKHADCLPRLTILWLLRLIPYADTYMRQHCSNPCTFAASAEVT